VLMGMGAWCIRKQRAPKQGKSAPGGRPHSVASLDSASVPSRQTSTPRSIETPISIRIDGSSPTRLQPEHSVGFVKDLASVHKPKARLARSPTKGEMEGTEVYVPRRTCHMSEPGSEGDERDHVMEHRQQHMSRDSRHSKRQGRSSSKNHRSTPDRPVPIRRDDPILNIVRERLKGADPEVIRELREVLATEYTIAKRESEFQKVCDWKLRNR
jgi:hypothetical protein